MIDLVILMVGGLTVGAVTTAVAFQKRKKNETTRLMRASLGAMGLQPTPTGGAQRARGKLPSGTSYLIDLTPSADNPLVFCHIGVHLHRATLLPEKCTFEVGGRSTTETLLAHKTTVGISEAGAKVQLDANPFLQELFGEALAELYRLEAYKLEPILKIRYQDQWLSIERSILDQAIPVRELRSEKEKIDYLHGIIAQTLQAAEKFNQDVTSASELWHKTFLAAPDFSNGRTEALKLLLTKHKDSEHARQAWDFVLEHGNLYDVLYIVNNHQKRALEDISEQRLVAFANAVLQQDNLDPSNLPSLIGQRLDVSALSNAHLDWRARCALLELWMFSLSGENKDLTRALAALIKDASRAQLLQLLRAIKRTAWVGAAASLASLSIAGIQKDIDISLTQAWHALAEKHQDALAGRADVERAMLDILVVYREPEAIKVIGLLGGKASIPVLHDLSKGNALVSPIAREAKKAIEQIIERLGKETRGALSVSSEEDRGKLSIATGESGSLTQIEDDKQIS